MQCGHLCSYHSEVRTTRTFSTKSTKTRDCLTNGVVARLFSRRSTDINQMYIRFQLKCTVSKCVFIVGSLRMWLLSFLVPPKMEPVLPCSTVDFKGWAQLARGTGGSAVIIRAPATSNTLLLKMSKSSGRR